MKKTFVVPLMTFAVAVLTLASCMKTDNTPQCTGYSLSQDRQVIDSFINDKGMSYMDFNSDINAYIGITNPGEGSMPAADSVISYKYSISLMDGTSLGTSDTISRNTNTGMLLKLSDFVNTNGVATVEYTVLSQLRKGGTAKVILPSSVYFGCNSQNTADGKVIPGNSQLIYDFTLTGVASNQ
ncbi:hypothetical protein A8C56_01335 [Niabella ginsenosidivorans]|uniref:peptidylprolyl isomerase n=1 Tax=Niabella ginsenosidivorans TaxID=1176587 RepID=A0A1A9HZP8_9BACT|nr:hypothetical protein [Niabella ginsenosidivorans]ANH79794.1 hypothetical protein A8C56_01335 [Niabella ginsenosidivorans]